MLIKKIVITGGPCAGKTTALSWIVENFTKTGWKVLTVEEAATQIIMRPLRPDVDLTVMGFQDLIMKTQIFLEIVRNRRLRTARQRCIVKMTRF